MTDAGESVAHGAEGWRDLINQRVSIAWVDGHGDQWIVGVLAGFHREWADGPLWATLTDGQGVRTSASSFRIQPFEPDERQPVRFATRRVGPQEAAGDACAAIAAFVVVGEIQPADLAVLRAAQGVLGRAMDA